MDGTSRHIKGEGDTVTVRNRDIPLLRDILPIMQQVCALEKRRDWQRDRMMRITQHITGMPGGGGMPRGLDEAFAMLSELDLEHEEMCREYVARMRRAERILNGIESQSMRAFVVMKYMMDIPDMRIREELNLTRTGFERARRCVEDAERMSEAVWREKWILYRKDTAEESR
jgi:hypothetical protein